MCQLSVLVIGEEDSSGEGRVGGVKAVLARGSGGGGGGGQP